MPRTGYNAESIARALDAHQAAGLIKNWRYADPGPRGTFRVLADLVDGESGFELRTQREAYVFVAGLASARHAVERQEAHPEFTLSRTGSGQPVTVSQPLTRNPGPARADVLAGRTSETPEQEN